MAKETINSFEKKSLGEIKMQTRKKYRLRPWVKVAMLFIFGVAVVSQIFSIFGAMASEEEPESKVVHGVVELQLNGEVQLSVLESEYYAELKDLTIPMKKGYDYFEIVTVVMHGNKVVNHYVTSGEELKEVEKKYEYGISTVRNNIMDALYEQSYN